MTGVVEPEALQLVCDRLWDALWCEADDRVELRRALRLHLASGQPYRFVAGALDPYADRQDRELAELRRRNEQLRRWARLALRSAGTQRPVLWRRVGDHAARGLPGVVEWADLVVSDDALEHVAHAHRCSACAGAGHVSLDDSLCTRCGGFGRRVRPVVQRGKDA